jgi:hypothetical protein
VAWEQLSSRPALRQQTQALRRHEEHKHHVTYVVEPAESEWMVSGRGKGCRPLEGHKLSSRIEWHWPLVLEKR